MQNDNSGSAKRRSHIKVGDQQAYLSYRDIRGDEAKLISEAMGVEEQSEIAYTGHLIEIRKSLTYTRISAHGKTQSREVMFFEDQSVIVIDMNRVEKQIVQTIYSPNGDIEVLGTGWSYERNGHHGPYEQVNVSSNNENECKAQAQKYDLLIKEALDKIAATTSRKR